MKQEEGKRRKKARNSSFILENLEQKIKTMSPNDLLQSRTNYEGDVQAAQSMQSTLAQYQTPTFLMRYNRINSDKLFVTSCFRTDDDQQDLDIIQQRNIRNLSSAAR